MACVCLVLTLVVDRAAYHATLVPRAVAESYIGYQLVRAAGRLPFWIAASLAVLILPAGTPERQRFNAVLVLGATLLSALLAEVSKMAIGLERPLLHDGAFVFRPLAERWHSGGLSFPSSHAAVAFGGASMMWGLRTSGCSLAMLVATGCAASRVMVGAHFLSDVVGSAMLAALVAATLLRAHRHRATPPAQLFSLPSVARGAGS